MVHVLERILVLSLVMVIWAVIAGALFDAYEAIRARCRQRRQRGRLIYERYAAEQALRNIKRRAIYELLTAEREHRDLDGSGDIIEGTAVEVRR
jgi:hypothetical protein